MLTYGKNNLKELLLNNQKIDILFLNRNKHNDLRNLALKQKILVKDLTNEFLQVNKLIGLPHQGAVAKISNPEILTTAKLLERIKDKKNPVLLILDQIEDPHNFGAIIRNSVAFDASGIIISKFNSSSLTPSVMKSSAGTWFKIGIAKDNINNAIKILKANEFWIVSTSLKSTHRLDELLNFNKPLAIILGSEGKGVRKSVENNADLSVKLEMTSEVESLNVSAASAIILNFLFVNK